MSHYKNKTLAEAFDEIYKLVRELYRYPESLRPSMKKEKLPLGLFMKGARILLSLTTQDNIQITINHHQKTNPIRKGQFIVSMSSSVLSKK